MIYVDRTSVAAPAVLSSAKAEKVFSLVKRFYARPLSSRLQERALFNPNIWNETKLELTKLFNGKCAYCETSVLTTNFGEVNRFRPTGGSINLNGKFDPDHYWWLAYEWFNLYLCCALCDRNKASRFPVSSHRVKVPKGARAKLGASWFPKDLLSEKPLLLDPCERDFDPDKHLLFDVETGRVAGLTERGNVTIEIFDLNRTNLIEGRKRVLEKVEFWVDYLVSTRKPEGIVEKLRAAQEPTSEYTAAQRQVIRRLLSEHASQLDGLKILEEFGVRPQKKQAVVLGQKPASDVHTKKEVRRIIKKSTAKRRAREKRKTHRAGLSAQYITSIEIHNFRVIEDLVLKFKVSPEGTEKSWMVLLGENGVGKSSILKAITLALQNRDYFATAKLDAEKFLRIGTDSGYVKVHLTDYSQPFHLQFNKDGFTKLDDNQIQTCFFGYGGTRLLPQGDHKPATTKGLIRAENLFDPFLPLINAKSWMLTLDRRPFGYSALALKDLLVRKKEDRLFRRNGEIKLSLADFGNSVPLEELSDGYQSIIALTADILKVMLETWPTADKAQGIILIDEIDVHLHPRWKVEIVSRLRRTFPRVQFIITTHDPLCLMGTEKGEVHVLHRDADTEQIVATQFDIPPGTTADRVLTGFWFGLPSTMDRATYDLLQQYYRLERAKRTPATKTRLLYLEKELRTRLGTFNDTSIDRIAQSVAAEFLADKDRSWTTDERAKARSAIRAKVNRKLRRRG